jgi:hypothetical protein
LGALPESLSADGTRKAVWTDQLVKRKHPQTLDIDRPVTRAAVKFSLGNCYSPPYCQTAPGRTMRNDLFEILSSEPDLDDVKHACFPGKAPPPTQNRGRSLSGGRVANVAVGRGHTIPNQIKMSVESKVNMAASRRRDLGYLSADYLRRDLAKYWRTTKILPQSSDP